MSIYDRQQSIEEIKSDNDDL